MTRHALPAEEIRQWLAERLAAHLGRESHEIRHDALMAEYGVDSLHAVALVTEVEDRWGLTLDAAVAWEHPTVARFADFLAAELSVGAAG
ncbi:acyl carrier protein [Streptomyces sp. NPDC059788]|uniref:acyl carrier protein n=1 Tax=Streptomyces sp. NPDC059788 TaxID=3346948 RepID=UPI0036597BF4